MYQYQGCGLPNVYLKNGYELVKTPYGDGVVIHDVAALHKAIGLAVTNRPQPLTPEEFRFLRQELDLSQSALAFKLGCDEQSVARWEKGKNKKIDPASDRLLRGLYQGHVNGDAKLASFLEILRKFESESASDKLVAQARNKNWKVA